MGTPAGQRNRKVVFERQGAPFDDGYTTQPGAWATWCTEWAKVVFGTGAERRTAAQEQATLTATFHVLRNSKTAELTPLDRIQFDGGVWDIASVVPSRTLNAEIDVTATRPA